MPGTYTQNCAYGNRVSALRTHLERHIERGIWCRVHYHYIGDGLSTSEANFRAAMEVITRRHSPTTARGVCASTTPR